MLDIYKIGFIVSTIILITSCALFGFIISNSYSNEVLSNTISAIGSILGGTAGLIAATAALTGINTWKKQLYHGKYLSIIWEAKAQLRKVNASIIECQVFLSIPDDNGNYGINNPRLDEAESKLKQNIAILKDTCSTIDTLIEKKGWLNANNAMFINGAWFNYKSEFIENYFTPTLETIKKYTEHVEINTKNNEKITKIINDLDEHLSMLETGYN